MMAKMVCTMRSGRVKMNAIAKVESLNATKLARQEAQSRKAVIVAGKFAAGACRS